MRSVADPDPFRSLTNRLPGPTTRNPMNGNDLRSQEQPYHDDIASDLPSVVQESEQDNTHRPGFIPPDAVRKVLAMNSQIEGVNPTQHISQSFYDSLLRKEKGVRPEVLDERSASQRTYEEGDTGHVDITSSFVTRHEQTDDLADSEPVDFSPVQSQEQLTQFPESQRFKTPAAAGKKRTYTGDIIETPAPVRNPLARADNSTSNSILGLSQAFAATQAASSPFSNGLPTGPRSDRPSPNIDVQLQPASTASSSPLLRPITELRRAATEPAARYVSVKQSQAERERQERAQVLNAVDGTDNLDYDFDEENSLMARQRRQRAREKNAKQELKSLSSPLLPPQDYDNTSPLKALHQDLSEGPIPDISTASPTVTDNMDVDDGTAALGSEAETEQEDDDQFNVTRSSQARKYTEENKENNSVLVPKTGPRHRSYVEQGIAQIDASPLLRHSTATTAMGLNADMHSSEPFRIMDSQPSQSRSKSAGSGKVATNTTSDVVDFVDQSSHPSASKIAGSAIPLTKEPDSSVESDENRRTIQWSEDQVDTNTHNTVVSVNTVHRDTIPETSSDIRAGASNKQPVIDQHSSTNKDSTVVTGNDFETAPTHINQPTALQSSQISSPIRTTPPGRKRRRLLEISAEPSPRKSQSQLSFNAEAVLQLDEDVEAADLLESSPSRGPLTMGASTGVNGVALQQPDESTHIHELPDLTVNDLTASRQSQGPELNNAKFTPETSQEIIGPGRLGRLRTSPERPSEEPASSPRLPAMTRHSIFDIQASPEKQTVTNLRLKVPIAMHSTTRRKKGREDTRNDSRMDRRLQVDQTKGSTLHNNSNHSHEPTKLADQPDVPEIRKSDLHNDDSLADKIVASHMVLAYYKGDPRGYYPAKLLTRTNSGGYLIHWEGYEPEEVDTHGVKALDIRIGDAVKVLADGFQKVPYIIKDFKDKADDVEDAVTDIRGYRTLIVYPKQRKGKSIDTSTKSQREVPVASIYLDVNMWAQMKLRNHDCRPLAMLAATTGMTTPLDRASSPGTPSSKGRRQTLPILPSSTPIMHGMFANMAFAISYDDPTQKNVYSNHVQANGGTIIHDSFHDLLEPDEIQLRLQHESVGFTALLTDRHSRKEKYVQALALGLPCLSGRWIEACVKQNKLLDWHSYLLPAGESAELDNATRSRVLPLIDMMSCKLSSLLESRPNLLGDAHVVVVVGRGKAEIKRAPYLFLIRAIGASHIDRVPDMESAKELLASEEGAQHEWVFVDDKDVKAMQNILEEGGNKKQTKARTKAKDRANESKSRCKVAGNELIVQSLILGQLYESQ